MLAYWHTLFSGFIPCRVVGRYKDDRGDTRLVIRTTAERRNYPKGWIEHAMTGCVVARPLRVSRQSLGRLYSYTLSAETIEALPVVSAFDHGRSSGTPAAPGTYAQSPIYARA
jgi:hypothetical protein